MVTMAADFRMRYHRWLDDLEALLEKLNVNAASPTDIESALLAWNTVNPAISNSAAALLPVVPMPLAERFREYLKVAGRLPEMLHAGPDAAPPDKFGTGPPLRVELEKSFSHFLATYAQLLAEASLATAA